MFEKLCRISSKLFMLQEIICKTIIVLFLGFSSCAVTLIFIPVMFLAKGLVAISSYTDEQGKIFCEELSDIYKTIKGEQNE